MSHPSDEQLGAHIDDALSADERARLDAHLAECGRCRDRRAEWAALDGAVASALAHDPGERYFEDFADRVVTRLAPPAADAGAAGRRSGWIGWLSGWATPRGLASVGGALAVVVVSVVAWNTARLRSADDPASALPAPGGEPVRDEPAQAQSMVLESAPGGAGAPDGSAPGTSAMAEGERAADAAPSRREPVEAGRMREMRTLDNGEQVPVIPPRAVPAPPAREAADDDTRSRISEIKRQQVAQPLAAGREAAPPAAEKAPSSAAEDLASTLSREAAPRTTAPLPLSARRGESAGRSLVPSPSRDEWRAGGAATAVRTVERCGRVVDPQGRALTQVTVTSVARARTVRTDEQGRFCVEMPESGGMLALDAVGFESRRVTLGAASDDPSLVLELAPVPVLGAAPTVRRDRGGAAPATDEDTGRAAPAPADAEDSSASGFAVPPSELEKESAEVRAWVERARKLRRDAGARPGAGTWDAVAEAWASAGEGARTPEVRARARHESLAARMRAWRLAPGPERRDKAAAAVAALKAEVPGGWRRIDAERWERELRR